MSHVTYAEEIHALETILARVRQEKAEVEKERDALAAHVEDWREGMRLAKDWHHERDERGYFGCQKEADRFLDWLADRDEGDGPATSLAHLKAQWQAEAIVEFGYRYGPESGVRAHSQQVANELHRQAEGGNDVE